MHHRDECVRDGARSAPPSNPRAFVTSMGMRVALSVVGEQETAMNTGSKSPDQPARPGLPRMPHERDQSSDSQQSEPREVIEQAYRDIEDGLQDTDRRGIRGYEKPENRLLKERAEEERAKERAAKEREAKEREAKEREAKEGGSPRAR